MAGFNRAIEGDFDCADSPFNKRNILTVKSDIEIIFLFECNDNCVFIVITIITNVDFGAVFIGFA